ncbi:DUF2490 domain-containing protein [Erythrobacter sp. BLCC-B19]|uniref:DUF2490 domain-containing protein n=1 Tax=Erythrobacter sp. BLCC-B19 TaxID=3025315 RepID=UPI00235EEA32|nr:DUF2490 domain-containing protein [Erythrobacter sp. BLCC-B19]WDA41709.1 DUF2490 domain-containing protein [Erythrobacter sp. BLCC-B19]
MPLVILLAAAPAAAEEDGNIWLGQFATINASEAVFVRAEAQQRFTQDAERLGQLLLRGLVGYRISDKASIGAGYAYVMTDPVGPAKLNEDRVYQELNLRLIESEGGTTLDSRTRLEWRSFRERPDSAWRLRQFVQLRVPVSENNKIVAFTEPFIDLDDGTVQRGGLSVWRNFVGVSIPLTKGVEVVPGYLNQQVFRDGEDRSDHVANVNLFMTF